jgi:hypothetical protein
LGLWVQVPRHVRTGYEARPWSLDIFPVTFCHKA